MSEIFSEVLNYHAPLKQKSVRGNHVFYDQRIMTKSKVKYSCVIWPSPKNFVAQKKAKNKCNSLNKKAKRKFFKEATKSGVLSNRTFWKTVKPFFTNKGCTTNDCINIEKDGGIVRDGKVLVELFNENYINISEISSANKPSFRENCEDSAQDAYSGIMLAKLYQNTGLISASKKLKVSFFQIKNLNYTMQLLVS